MSSVTAAVPGRYRLLFRTYGVRGVMGWSIVARFPLGMIPLGLVLLVRDAGGSYGMAGLVVAAYSIASAVGAPVAGRLVDRRGQAWVLLPRAALYPAALAAVCVLALADAPTWTLAVAAAVAAALVPPIAACVRTLWPRLLRTADLRSTAYSLDAALQEVFFTLGPLLVAAIAAAASPSAALLTAAALGGLGTLAFVVRTPSRDWRPDGDARRDGSWLGPLTSPGVRALVLMSACYGAAFGSVEVAMPAFAEDHGGRELGGIALAAFAAGSLAGGLIAGARPAGDPRRQLVACAAAMSVALVLPLTAGSLAVMTALVFVAGMPIAPAFAGTYSLLDRLAPAGTQAEGFAWLGTAVTTGIAAGTAGGGALIEASGVDAALLLGVAAVLAGGLVVLRGHGVLRPARAPGA
jgi:MFS family permease